MGRLACLWIAAVLALPAVGQVAELRPPASVAAGSRFSLQTSGAGDATFYLIGPSRTTKQKIRLGQAIEVQPADLQDAGRYLAILCTPACQSATFYVVPADAAHLDLLVHPSRVPVRQPDVISGVALAFDRFHNLRLAPGTVDFQIRADGAAPISHVASAGSGIAWFRAASSSRAGAAQVTATLGDLSVRQVVQQVASDPCNLRITAEASSQGITVQTEPVKDCAGNPVPDGTMVTFTKVDAAGQSTVDAPIKKGIASARMTGRGPAVITVASGLVMGNEVHLGEQP